MIWLQQIFRKKPVSGRHRFMRPPTGCTQMLRFLICYGGAPFNRQKNTAVKCMISDAGEINKETGGISSTTYSFKNKAGKVFYLRIPVLEIEKYEAEVYVHNLLQSQGVKVPRVVFFDKFS